MQRLLRTTLILSVNIIYFSSFAQRVEHHFGEITHDEVTMTGYVNDQDAGAVVLFDHGKSVFVRDEFGSSAYIINFKRVKQIKIFDKSEYNQANIEIPYYTDGYGKTEKVFNIKAIAYNNENGFLKKSELDPNSVFTEKTNDYWSKKKFAIPNVKEGSIIEFSYELNTPFSFNMPDWKFQSTIPTLYSEYEVRMIPFYEYVFLLQGINKFNYQNSYVDDVSRKLGSIEFTDYIHQYVLRDIPAFRDESYISSIDDYILKMDFQMAKIHSQSGSTTEIMTTWAKLNKLLLKHEKFGKYLAGSKKVVEKNILGTFDFADKSSRQKSKLLIEFMKNQFSWNGNYGKYSTKKAKEFFEDKKGNTSDMNLFLVALLQAHGLDAVPVLISTRDHGKINADYPFDHFFNSVVVVVKLENDYILTDASDPLTPYNTIPANCLNDRGLLVEKGEQFWMKLIDHTASLSNERFDLKILPEDGFIEGEYEKQTTGYDAKILRNSYQDQAARITEDYENKGFVEIEDVKSVNHDKTESPYILGFRANYPIEDLGDIILIPPFLNSPMSENSLKQEERKYPVDMVYKKSRAYSSHIIIPEGYEVSSLPQQYNANDDLVKIEYSAHSEGREITVEGVIIFKKSSYEPKDYDMLKSYFSRIVKQFNESIILKKI